MAGLQQRIYVYIYTCVCVYYICMHGRGMNTVEKDLNLLHLSSIIAVEVRKNHGSEEKTKQKTHTFYLW